MKTICIIGTLDTKGEECELLKDAIERRGFRTLVVDAGVLGEPFFPLILVVKRLPGPGKGISVSSGEEATGEKRSGLWEEVWRRSFPNSLVPAGSTLS
jgi:hypothetical protein